jgi:hypothetical protein
MESTPSSFADIAVAKAIAPNAADWHAFVDGLQKLAADCGEKANKHHVAIVLTTACIEEGVDTRGGIIAALQAAGLKHDHAAVVLREETGDDRRLHRWQRDEAGRYRLHPG